jgi:hypothetical protein
MAKKNSNPYSEFPKTSELVDRLLSTFPQYKNYTKDQFFSMLDKIAKAETHDSNIRQLEGGPGRGYYQMELTSAPYAYKRAININTSLKERNQPTIELPPYNQDFTKLSKDDQAFYVLSNMVGAAGAKREQGNPNAYLDPNRPKEMWISYHWAGKEKDKADRIKHWESVHGKSPKVIDKKVSKPVAKFQPNKIGIPIFTTKGDFIWDNTPAQIETALYGVGPTVQKANAVNQAAAVGTPLFDKGGLIKRKDGSYSRRGLWDNIRANRGSGRKPTAEMLRQERKIKAQKKEDGGWLDAYDDGSWVMDGAIPTPTTPSYYPDYPDRTLTTRQMGTPKAPMYAAGATVWTKQDTPLWAAGTPTPTSTQANYKNSRAISPESAIPYPEVTYPKSARYFTQAPVMQGYNPYNGPMRLHAPDTTRMDKGGKVKKDKYSSIPRIGLRYPTIIKGSFDSSYYSPSEETIYLSNNDKDPASLQHELFHHWQKLRGDLEVPEEQSGPIKKPSIVEKNADSYYNRRDVDLKDAYQNFTQSYPSFLNVPFNLLYNKELNPAMYYYPKYAEGEAEEYEKYVQQGNTPVFPYFKQGGRVTPDYKKRVGIPYAINPGVSNAGMYVGPTTQRGITFEQGGPIYNWIPNYPRVGVQQYNKKQSGGWLDNL